MLTLVRLRTSIPVGVVPLTLNLKGGERRRRECYCHLKSGVLTTQFVRCYCSSSIESRRRERKMTLSADATPNSSQQQQEEENQGEGEEVVVQYVVLRRDLIASWPLGSVVTQGCHASVAAIWEHKDDASTLRYCSPPDIDSMHKVTLEVKGEPQIVNLSEKLKSSGILHKLWIEQPENIPTCLATKPYPKSVVSPFFRKLKLCK